jgi:hypothetical protein
VSEAGGLGSLPCAQLTSLQIREAVNTIRLATSGPINLTRVLAAEALAKLAAL